MSKTVPFAKVAGAGNDFVLVDGRRGRPLGRSPSALAKEWCDRKRSIGADGLLWVQRSTRGNARMRIFNPDGSEAEMCGNGLRCVAWYLHAKDHSAEARCTASSRGSHGRRDWRVETGAGVMRAQITGPERVRLSFLPPKKLRLGIPITWKGKRRAVHSVDTGVPHAVLLVPRLDAVDLGTLGPFIRRHRTFKPQGTNVDLLQIQSPHRASIRTYERGVERETLACGTGAVASVVIGTALGRLKPPVQVTTASGQKLTVGFRLSRKPWEGICLEGPARILFEGGIPL